MKDENEAIGIATLQKCCAWLFIPKGRSGTGRVRISARLMIAPEASLNDVDLALLADIFGNWPQFLATTTWKPEVLLAYGSGSTSKIRSLGPFEIAVAFREQAGGESQIPLRGEIWRAAFPDPASLVPLQRPPKPGERDTQPHTQAAQTANELYGGLHSLAIAASADDPQRLAGETPNRLAVDVGNKGYNFAGAPSGLAASGTAVQGTLRGIGAYGERRAAIGASPSGEDARDLVLNWAQETKGEEPIIWNVDPKNANPGATSIAKMLASTRSDTARSSAALRRAKDRARTRRGTLRLADDMRLIAHHGWLLRYFGLAIDFTRPDTSTDFDPSRIGAYSAGVVIVDESSMYPRSVGARGLPQSSGIIQLDARTSAGNPRFKIVQLDVHGAVRKFMQMTSSERAQTDAAQAPGEQRYETARQNSAGLTLTDSEAGSLRAANAPEIGPEGSRRLYAEDITIGIRPDVQSLQPRENLAPLQAGWKSLTGWKVHAAHAKFGPFKEPFKSHRDVTENFAQVLAGESVIGFSHRLLASDSKLVGLASEELFTWTGWSLAVCHPDPGDAHRDVALTELQINNLVITLQATGDLPALRFGRGYRFAARAVFADGDGPSLLESVTAHQCGQGTPFSGLDGDPNVFAPYLRFEPIAPPDIHLSERLDYAAFPQTSSRKAVLSSSDKAQHIRKREVRYVVPPSVPLEQAISHGMYDSIERRRAPPGSAFKGVCLTRGGQFPNVSNPVLPNDTSPAPRSSVAGDGSDTIYHPSFFARDPLIPYLPDPWAVRLIVGVFRASDLELLAWEYHDYYAGGTLAQWPQVEPLRLEIARAQDRYVALPERYGSSEGHVDLVKRDSTMVLVVPPGESLHVRFWHEVDERMLAQSAIVDQMADFLQTIDAQACAQVLRLTGCLNDKQQSREQLIQCLSQWQELRHARVRSQISSVRARGLTNVTSFGMINPTETLDVVHAVDRPTAPSFLWSGLASEEIEQNFFEKLVVNLPARKLRTFEQSFRLRRQAGRIDATLAGDLEFDRAASSRVDIEARWEDTVDDLMQAEPTRTMKNAVMSVEGIPPVLSPAQGGTLAPNRRLTPDVPDDNNLLLLDGVRTALNRARNEDLRDKKLTVNFGDARARIVTLSVTAQSRFAAEYNNGTGPFTSHAGELGQVVCSASAPPQPVLIDYIIPQYRWLENNDGHQSHERRGGCLRVWLKRPWFSSGPDERLALVCWPETTFDKEFQKATVYSALVELCGINKDPPQFIERFVTRWGLDPVWGGPDFKCTGNMPPEAFRGHVCDVDSIRMRSKEEACFPVLDLRECEAVKAHLQSYEEGSSKVALVLYEPLYDKPSRRWYVDVQIDEKYAYFPFVRLAFARYQRYALPGHELSDIGLQEFVQLLPTRRTGLVVKRGKTLSELNVSVLLRGQLPERSSDWISEVNVRLEHIPIATWDRLRKIDPDLSLYDVAWVPEGALMPMTRSKAGWNLDRVVDVREDRLYSIVLEENERGPRDVGAMDPMTVNSVARTVFRDRLFVSRISS